MDDNLEDKESLLGRIQQLEHERDELRKDIEQLCMQQAGPSYLGVATRMHFQRTTALEQEIESFKKKLVACTREKLNLQEELLEAYRIKTQLADLHGTEVAKNIEMEKQVKFFQGCVAAAFAERDQSIMEAEKAKEKEELMSQRLEQIEKRLEELSSGCFQQKKLNHTLEVDLAELEVQNENFKKVIDKFFEIRKNSLQEVQEMNSDDKCACLLQDPAETWTFNDPSTSEYISALEEEVEKVRRSVDNLQTKLRMGLEIENHLKKKVRELEKKNILAEKMITNGIADLCNYHSAQSAHIMNLLGEGRSFIKLTVDTLAEIFRLREVKRRNNLGHAQHDVKQDEYGCGGVHISKDEELEGDGSVLPIYVSDKKGDVSEAFAQALQEKVSALLLLSQQEERHLLERNVNAALQKKIEELQRNLLQVTNEKVKALLELARLKQEYELLEEKAVDEMKQGKADISEKIPVAHERDGRLRNLLKKTYLNRWVGPLSLTASVGDPHLNDEVNFSGRRSSSIDYARMKIENATLKETMESMEYLTTTIHRLRLALLRVKESISSEGTVTSMSGALGDIISEANLVKTALGSSLPVSWSSNSNTGLIGANMGKVQGIGSSSERIDSVSAAGFEMVELLLLAAQILKNESTKVSSISGE